MGWSSRSLLPKRPGSRGEGSPRPAVAEVQKIDLQKEGQSIKLLQEMQCARGVEMTLVVNVCLLSCFISEIMMCWKQRVLNVLSSPMWSRVLNGELNKCVLRSVVE